MKVNYYRDFFIQQFEKYKEVCNILKDWGYQKVNFKVSFTNYVPSKDRLVVLIDKKKFFEDVMSSIPYRLNFYLRMYYQFRKGEITEKELRRCVSLPMGIFISAVNWGSYLFYENYQYRKEYENGSYS